MSKRNQQLREEFNLYLDENGIMLKWIAAKLNMVASTLSRWRGGGFNLGEEKMVIIENYLEKHK